MSISVLNDTERPPCLDRDVFRFPDAISVFFPAFNDAPSLPSLLERTFDVLRRCVADYEVIVVNDGSSDSTAELLDHLRVKYAPYLRVVTHEVNRGYGGALRSGFAASTKRWVFYTDGDGQYDPTELERLLRAATLRAGLVNGYKIERHDPWHRVAIGWLYNRFARALFGIKLRDIDCDFRLVRRDLLLEQPLESTSGTVCVELVKKLERADTEVIEVPVHHYPREHGRSQFFRVRSLGSTFAQLWRLYFTMVLLPLLAGDSETSAEAMPRLRRPHAGLIAAVAVAVAVLSLLVYGRSLGLPLISDDYLQIRLARVYAPINHWGSLAQDALYRCRATSLVLTYWTEKLVGIDPLTLRLSSLFIHILNALLVFAIGYWRPIGWKVSAVAACFFAVCQQHHEAVIWYAAVHEVLVFAFAMAAFLAWVHWLQARSTAAYVASVVLFALALLSKESAVALVPVFAFAQVIEERRISKRLVSLLPAIFLSGWYFGMAYMARSEHQHFNDGTFALSAPFIVTLIHSIGRLMWFWGALSLGAIVWWKARRRAGVVLIGFLWMIFTLLPYSFLTYMSRVPSRHTYLATFGLALIIAAGFLELWQRTSRTHVRWAAAGLGMILVLHHTGYLWFWKHRHFELRAAPTEKLVEAAETSGPSLYVRCFPYPQEIARDAIHVRFGEKPALVFLSGGASSGIDLCNEVVHHPTSAQTVTH